MRLARGQHSVFTRAQAVGFGVTPDQIKTKLRNGTWERVVRDVYRISGSPQTWRQRLMVAVLAAGPGAAVSGRAAAALWRLPGFAEGRVEVTQARRPSRRYPYGHEHSTTFLPPNQVKVIDGIPVTSVDRTVFDLCGRVTQARAERLVKTVVSRNLTTLGRLSVALAETGAWGRPGTTGLRAALAAVGDDKRVTESELEDLLVAVLVAAGLEVPTKQVEVGGTTAPIGRVDFLYRLAGVVVEADSKAWHGNWLATEADHRRDALLTAAGFHVIRTNWHQLATEPDLFVNAVRGALQRAA